VIDLVEDELFNWPVQLESLLEQKGLIKVARLIRQQNFLSAEADCLNALVTPCDEKEVWVLLLQLPLLAPLTSLVPTPEAKL